MSHALEYYVADAALAWLAEQRGDVEFAKELRKRAAGYKNYYSKESGTLRPINPDGTFLTPFNPRQGENFEPVPGINGGNKKFTEKLQKVFDDNLYDPANEPNIAYPYLFSRVKGEEWRTQKEVNRLLSKYFTNNPDGIPGNDDTGTMSTWAIFSMMGFYPDCPGEPFYTLTSPVFDRVEIDTPGKTLVIEADRTAPGDIFIQQMQLGGKPLKNYRISHDDLMKAGNLKFKLSNQPKK